MNNRINTENKAWKTKQSKTKNEPTFCLFFPFSLSALFFLNNKEKQEGRYCTIQFNNHQIYNSKYMHDIKVIYCHAYLSCMYLGYAYKYMTCKYML